MIHLGNRIIRTDSKRPYVIAEAGVNHECQMELALRQIDEAKLAGADGIKFQAYKAETISIVDSPSYWDRKMEPAESQFALFKRYDHFGEKEYRALSDHCKKVGIDFLCTPFDFASADFLFDLVSFYKISSSDLTNHPFLRHIAKKGKPIVLSTGASTIAEIDSAVRVILSAAKVELALLHCVLNYPCKPEAANLETIRLLQNIYPELCIGYSDHVPADSTMMTLTQAVTMGAVIIEKHFTHDKKIPGGDHLHSMDQHDLRIFLSNLDWIEKVKGSYQKTYLENESLARKYARRSIVSARPLKQGQKITEADLTFKRPATGLSPQYTDLILGATLNRDVAADVPLQFEYFNSLVTKDLQ